VPVRLTDRDMLVQLLRSSDLPYRFPAWKTFFYPVGNIALPNILACETRRKGIAYKKTRNRHFGKLLFQKGHSMANGKLGSSLVLTSALVASFGLGGCGLKVPEKDLFSANVPAGPGQASPQGKLESDTIAHIRCEIGNGILNALSLGPYVQWLDTWGSTVTVKLTVDELEMLTPGVSFSTPFENMLTVFPKNGNIISPQSFTFGFGLSGSAHSTRLETITFTYSNKDLVAEALIDKKTYGDSNPCGGYRDNLVVEGDLEIGQFIYDKATIAEAREASNGDPRKSPFGTLSDDLKFVTAYGGSVDPVWHLARFTGNTSPTLFNATRTHTNEMILTIGPIAEPAKGNSEAVLSLQAQNVHNAALIGSATASANQSQLH
jgi:hypothetical protein